MEPTTWLVPSLKPWMKNGIDLSDVHVQMKLSVISSPDDMDEIIFGITKIKKVDVLPNNHETFLVSSPVSDYSIYVWFDENTAFFYTEAEKIYLNRDTTYLFSQFQNFHF